MSFRFISKIIISLYFLFIISCQSNLNLFENNQKNKNVQSIINKEYKDRIDLTYTNELEDGVIDFYSDETINFDFTNSDFNKIKIKNYGSTLDENIPLNVFIVNSEIYTINIKGEILKFDASTGNLIDKLKIDLPFKNSIPISISLINNDFVIGFKSGEIIRCTKNGKILWMYKKTNFLNTPIKYQDSNLFILYPEDFVILSFENGKVIYEENFDSNNIIQSVGGKLINYFNIIFFILPNSEFNAVDTLLFEKHYSNLQNIETKTSLNNLDDYIHVNQNTFSYLDNGTTLYTYDLIEDKFLLSEFEIIKGSSSYFFNNTLINRYKNSINVYNIINGNLFITINTNKILKKDSKIIKVTVINKKLHLFTSDGKLLIINKNFEIENVIDIKIRNIVNIFIYQENIFISTVKGTTYIL